MTVPALLLVAQAIRSGLSRMMAALAFVGAWLALAASAFKSSNQVEAGEAARNYAIVMAVLSFLYFRGKARPAKSANSPPDQDPQL